MKKPIVALLHASYWGIYLMLLFTLCAMTGVANGQRIMRGSAYWILMSAFAILPGTIGFYTAYLVLFRRCFVRRQTLRLIVAALLASLAAAIVGELGVAAIAKSIGLHVNWAGDTIVTMGIVIALNAFLNAAVGLVLKGFISGYNDMRLRSELEQKNHEMELTLLKSRINPHFLFNTINNIDVLIEQDTARASSYLNKLSRLMRFMLYETKSERIPLAKELEYITEYMELQKIRSANADYANLHITGQPGGLTIPPMLFIPFIENAFKHADDKRTSGAVDVRISITPDELIFECSNVYNGSQQPSLTDEPGIGNDLIEKRLALLYPRSHNLEISKTTGLYKVKLRITP